MQTTDEQPTNVSEVQNHPKSLFRKLGATANALVAGAKNFRLNKNMTPEEKTEAIEIRRHEKEMKRLRKELQKTEKLIRRYEQAIENDESTRSKYPEIFKNPDEDAIDEFQAEHLERLKKEDWISVLRSYNGAYQLSDVTERAKQINMIDTDIVNVLCKELGIEEKVPTVKSVARQDSDELGGYLEVNNSILLDESFIEKGALTLANDSEYSAALWLPIVRIMIISHETWHAYQHNGDIPEERKKMYDINWQSYNKKSEDYSSQLVEREAVKFSESLVTDIIRKLESPQEQ